MDAILAEFEIRSLLIRERYYRDVGQWDRLRSCFHPDAKKTLVNVSWYTGEIDGFVSGSENMWRRGHGTGIIHNINPSEITVNGDRALAISTCQILSRNTFQGTALDLSCWIRVVTRLERIEDELRRWKMLSLEVVYLKDSIASVVTGIPSDLQQEFQEFSNQSRPSYKCTSWNIHRLVGNPNVDMPGSDRPDTVAEVLHRNYSWIAMD